MLRWIKSRRIVKKFNSELVPCNSCYIAANHSEQPLTREDSKRMLEMLLLVPDSTCREGSWRELSLHVFEAEVSDTQFYKGE